MKCVYPSSSFTHRAVSSASCYWFSIPLSHCRTDARIRVQYLIETTLVRTALSTKKNTMAGRVLLVLLAPVAALLALPPRRLTTPTLLPGRLCVTAAPLPLGCSSGCGLPRLHWLPRLLPPTRGCPRMGIAAPPLGEVATSSFLSLCALIPVISIIAMCMLGSAATALRILIAQKRMAAAAVSVGRDASGLGAGEKVDLSMSLKLWRRIFTGFTLGAVVSLWIFSGTRLFLSVLAAMAIVAQNEYYLMARQNGCYPTWKLATLGSVAMYVAACSENLLVRDAIFPLTGIVTIVYLLLRQVLSPPPKPSHHHHHHP